MIKIDDLFEVLLNDTDFDYDRINEIVDVNYVLDHMQNIIVQAAALSRYFWPPPEGVKNAKEIYTHRGIYLREQFNMLDTNILKDRKLRNMIEHFDEKLDNYLQDDIVGHIIPQMISFKKGVDEVPLHIFRAYYLDTGEFEMLGKKCELKPIMDEVKKIHEYLLFFDENGGSIKGKHNTKIDT